MTLTAMGPRAYRGVVVFCLIGALLADGQERHVCTVGAWPILAIFSFAGYLSRTNLRPVSVERVLALSAPGHGRALVAASSEISPVQLQRIAEERRALHRVATLAAQGAPPERIFDAAAGEMGRLLRADHLAINRVEPDHTTTVVGQWTHPDVMSPAGGHWAVQHGTIEATVIRTGRPARGHDGNRTHAMTYVVACPIMVDGRTWGTVTHSLRSRPQPEDTEQRMVDFVEFVGAAMANSESRAELVATRARAVAASDATRHRIERDLHDAVQQRLISLGLKLDAAEAALLPEQHGVRRQLADTARDLTSVLDCLRDITHGLHPTVLSDYGLGAALRSLARRCPIPVELNVYADRRLAEPVQATIYYVVAEAMTNTLKHARATRLRVDVRAEEDSVRVCVHDDGIGGADPAGGSGLIGLHDRVGALAGRLRIESPAGHGTSLLFEIPLKAPTQVYDCERIRRRSWG